MQDRKKKVEILDSIEDLFAVDRETDNPNNPPKDTTPFTAIASKADPSSPSKAKLDTSVMITPQTPASAKSERTDTPIHLIPAAVQNPDGFIQCPPALRVIPVTRTAYEDMIMLAKGVNEISREKWGPNSQKMEVYCYVLADPDEIPPDRPARISEIIIPKHRATETGVEVGIENLKDIQKYILETGKVVLGWAHSHGHFEVYSSATDERNHQTLLNETSNIIKINNFQLKYVYGITVVESGEKFGILLTQYPCGHVQRVEAEFDIQGEGYTEDELEARFQDIKQQIRQKVNLVQPSQQQSESEMISDLTQELMQQFIRNLWKAKNMVVDDLPDTADLPMVQKLLGDYDTKLLAGAEEAFNQISEKVMKAVRKFQDEV
jgi:hypothetical protein